MHPALSPLDHPPMTRNPAAQAVSPCTVWRTPEGRPVLSPPSPATAALRRLRRHWNRWRRQAQGHPWIQLLRALAAHGR